jgi:hypothetical protein
MALMFCVFKGDHLILRTLVTAKAVHSREPEWEELHALFPDFANARNISYLISTLSRRPATAAAAAASLKCQWYETVAKLT